jgi:hypothetical protein
MASSSSVGGFGPAADHPKASLSSVPPVFSQSGALSLHTVVFLFPKA